MGKQMTFSGLTISQHCIESITDLLQQPPSPGPRVKVTVTQ